MDAFFAAVEERDKPRLKGRPIVVGADPNSPAGEGRGRGVVSTANYKARAYGIHSAMPISRAWRLAETAKQKGKPATVFMSGNHRRYAAVSAKIMKILSAHSPTIEQTSIDEAYINLSGCGSYKKARVLAQKIKNEIKKKENLTASIGIGPNKLIAKMASDMEKPDGLTVIPKNQIRKFLAPLSIRKIPGIGPKTEIKFTRLGVKTIEDIEKFSRAELEKLFGKWGLDLYAKVRGTGSVKLIQESKRKSIGEETTFSSDSLDIPFISVALKNLCIDVYGRFKVSEFSGFRTIVLKVRFADFTTKSRSKTFPGYIRDQKTLMFESLRLLLPFFADQENKRRQALRLIGVRLEKFK